MAATLKASVRVELTATQRGANDFDSGGAFAPKVASTLSFANGTGAGQSNLLFTDERTVGSGANDDIDLAGVLTDVFGATLTFVEITGVIVINAPKSGPANTTNLTIGNAASPFVGFLGGTAPTIGPLRPGAVFAIAAGDAAGLGAVTPATADLLRIANSAGASAVYQIAILGRSA
jgi:hypothetical protein